MRLKTLGKIFRLQEANMKTDLENIQRLYDRFKRPVPSGTEYRERLAEEFELILNLRFTEYFLQICDIIDLTTDIKHMT